MNQEGQVIETERTVSLGRPTVKSPAFQTAVSELLRGWGKIVKDEEIILTGVWICVRNLNCVYFKHVKSKYRGLVI